MYKHDGDILKKYLKINDIEISSFSKEIHMSRGNVYLLFGKAKIDVEDKKNITDALGKDIFQNIDGDSSVSSRSMAEPMEKHETNINMDTSKEVQLLRDQIAALNRHIASQEREIREHLRTIADLRRDITIDAQKETIGVLKEQKQDLQERLGFKHSAGETPANPHAGTLTKRGDSATDKHKAGSNR